MEKLQAVLRGPIRWADVVWMLCSEWLIVSRRLRENSESRVVARAGFLPDFVLAAESCFSSRLEGLRDCNELHSSQTYGELPIIASQHLTSDISRMPRDGCKECSRRRIKCDKAEPECAKCTKKGIKCTGVGRQIRFVKGVISKGKREGQVFPGFEGFATQLSREIDNPSMSTPCSEEPTELINHVERIPVEVEANNDIDDDGAEEIELVRYQGQHDLPAWTLPDDGTFMPFYYDPGADLTLELLKPGIQMLFNHCKLGLLLFVCLVRN
jgi:hypothetical protein